MKHLKQFEGYWQKNVSTFSPYGLNYIKETSAELKWSDKNILYQVLDKRD